MDLANEKILPSSDKQFADLKFSDLKFTRGESQINDINLFSLNGKIYYVISKVLNDKTYYYAADINTTMIFSLIYSAVMCVIFTAGALLLTGYALRGYKAEYEHFFSEANEGSAKDSQQTTSYAKTWKRITGEYRKSWDAKSPLMKAYTVSQVMCGILMILLLRAGFVSNSATLFSGNGKLAEGDQFLRCGSYFYRFFYREFIADSPQYVLQVPAFGNRHKIKRYLPDHPQPADLLHIRSHDLPFTQLPRCEYTGAGRLRRGRISCMIYRSERPDRRYPLRTWDRIRRVLQIR